MPDNDTKNIGLRGVTVADTRVSLVDGANGRLLYRGFAIQDLAESASFEEVVYLLLEGKPPEGDDLQATRDALAEARAVPGPVLDMLRVRPATADPTDVMQSAVSALADHDPDLGSDQRPAVARSALRLISRFAGVAAAWHRLRNGEEPVAPDPALSHAGSFLHGLWGRAPTEDETKLMDLLLVLHAEHTFNASTFAVREVASTQAHLYASVGAGVGALSGALHGGANARVMRMLLEVGDPSKVDAWVQQRMAAGQRVMGLGHAVYKTEDPRAAILRRVAQRVLAGRDEERWLTLGLEVERVARAALREKKGLDLYPNVDFYSSPVLYGLGLAVDMFPVFFAVSRVSGWNAHFIEERFSEAQPKPALYRPQAHYTGRLCGPEGCRWVPVEARGAGCPCGKDFDGCDEALAVAEP